MKKLSLKISLVLILSIILFSLLSISVNAVEEKKSELVKTSNNEYIIYIEDFENENFSFALSNQNTDEGILTFNSNWIDTNGVNVACIDNEMGLDLSKDIYLWIKDKDSNFVIKAEKLDLNSAITTEEMEKVENLTKLIEVKVDKDTSTKTVDNVDITTSLGKVVITSSEEMSYKYSLIKTSDSESVSNLVKLIQNIKDKYETMSMFDKVSAIKKINSEFNSVIENLTWEDVNNMTINQPQDSKDGEEYVVFLKQVDTDGSIVNEDVQVLNAYVKESTETKTEIIPTVLKTILPKTGESIAIFIVLIILVIAIIAVLIRIKSLKTNGKNEK